MEQIVGLGPKFLPCLSKLLKTSCEIVGPLLIDIVNANPSKGERYWKSLYISQLASSQTNNIA